MYLDWVAAAIELTGLYLIVRRNRKGFLCGLVCNFVWVIYCVSQGVTYGLIPVCVAMAYLNVTGWRKWR